MTVPYIFQNQTGNIQLSELDANFANVQAYSDSAGVVTASAQPAITSVGTLGNLVVSGNITAGYIATGNLTTTNSVNFVGNVTGGNLFTAGIISATGNSYTGSGHVSGLVTVTGSITGSNLISNGSIIASGIISAIGNIITTANIASGNLIANGYVTSANGVEATSSYAGPYTDGVVLDYLTGNARISAGSADGILFYNSGIANVLLAGLSSGGALSVTGNITSVGAKNTGLEVVNPNYINITGNAQTGNLSTTTSTNFLVANNTGYTFTVNMPATPVDGQITRFTVAGNTVTLVAGTGTLNSSFAGSTTVGTGYKYTYRASTTTWYKSI